MSWLAVTDVISARAHILLLDEVNRRGIAHDDIEAVRQVWADLQARAVIRLRDIAKEDRAELAARVARRRERFALEECCLVGRGAYDALRKGAREQAKHSAKRGREGAGAGSDDCPATPAAPAPAAPCSAVKSASPPAGDERAT